MEYYFIAEAVVSVMQSQKQAALMRQQADAEELSGKISLEQAQFEAKQARIQGEQQATFIQRESERKVGQDIAVAGASGTEVKGSNAIVIGNQVYADQMAVANTMANASAKARSVEAAGMSAAATSAARAGTLRTQAGITEEGGWLSAIADGVGAYAKYYDRTGGTPTPSMGKADYYGTGDSSGGPSDTSYPYEGSS